MPQLPPWYSKIYDGPIISHNAYATKNTVTVQNPEILTTIEPAPRSTWIRQFHKHFGNALNLEETSIGVTLSNNDSQPIESFSSPHGFLSLNKTEKSILSLVYPQVSDSEHFFVHIHENDTAIGIARLSVGPNSDHNVAVADCLYPREDTRIYMHLLGVMSRWSLSYDCPTILIVELPHRAQV